MTHSPFWSKIEKIQEGISHCDRSVTPMLVDAGLILGHGLEKKEISSLEFEQKMEEVKKLSMRFNNECLCTRFETMLDLIMPEDSKKK